MSTAVDTERRNLSTAAHSTGMTGTNIPQAVNLQRSYVASPEVRQWIKEGRVFHGYTGVLTDPELFKSATLVRQQPLFMVRVPAGIVMIPIFSQVTPEATTAAVLEVLVSCCNNDPGTTNMTAITPTNVNTLASSTNGIVRPDAVSAANSQVYAYGTNVGNTGTAPTGVADLFRWYSQADYDAITGAPTPPITYAPLAGMGQECVIGNNNSYQAFLFYAVAGSTSLSTGFSIHYWAEFTYSEYYGS